MTWSKYNYLFAADGNHYLYNFLSNFFMMVNEEMYKELQEYHPNSQVKLQDKTLYKMLVEKKVLVNSDADEINRMKLMKHDQRFNRQLLSLTIAPTLHCNFNCSYCFETARPAVYMDDHTERRLMKFVNGFEVKFLNLSWYGGEPLMDFERIINITEKVKRRKMPFIASITTNGYLCDEEKIKAFKRLRIGQVQITLDGTKEVHDQRRPLSDGSSSFNTIWKNLESLVRYRQRNGIGIVVRVNIDSSNVAEFPILHKMIDEAFGGQVFVYPGFVQETAGSCTSNTDCNLNRHEQAKFKINMFESHGIESPGFYPSPAMGECMARHINSFLVDPTGKLYKCWADIGNEKHCIGNIHKKGKINHTILNRYLIRADPFDSTECRECRHLPVCGGGCPHYAVQNEYENTNYDICHVSKGHLKEFLRIHHKIKLKNEN